MKLPNGMFIEYNEDSYEVFVKSDDYFGFDIKMFYEKYCGYVSTDNIDWIIDDYWKEYSKY